MYIDILLNIIYNMLKKVKLLLITYINIKKILIDKCISNYKYTIFNIFCLKYI